MGVRAFLAVDLPEAIRLDLAKAVSRRLPADVKAKPVAAENLHVTLHFLGDTPDDRIMAAHAIAQRAAEQVRSFEIGVDGLVCVPPSGKKLRMIWATVADPSGQLAELHRLLGQGLGEGGFPVEHRPLKPHVTLVRVRYARDPEPIRSMVEAVSRGFGRGKVSELTLYSSELTKSGPIYAPLAKCPLR